MTGARKRQRSRVGGQEASEQASVTNSRVSKKALAAQSQETGKKLPPAFSLVEMKERESGKQALAAQSQETGKKLLRAFSLVEMMVVIAVIGILVSMALPRFRTFIAKSRMAEAAHNLAIIDKLQMTYHTHFQMLNQDDVWYDKGLMGQGSCSGSAKKNKLGFRVEDCTKLRYYYTAGGSGGDEALNEAGRHHKIYPACSGAGVDDEWKIHRKTVTGNYKLEHTKDVVEQCE